MRKQRFTYSKEHVDYIRSIAEGRYNKEIAEMFNEKFGLDKTANEIRALKSNRKIRSNVPPGEFKRELLFTKEQEEFLKKNAIGTGNETLTNLFNKEFETNFLVTQVIAWKNRNAVSSGLDGRFEEGREPWNKGMKGLNTGGEAGWFKKGQAPINCRPVGSERITVDGHVEIKTADPSDWRHKHVVVWEKHNGPVPENHVVVFLDSNKENITLDNLMLISRSELVRMNQEDFFFNDPELTKAGLNIVRLNNKIIDIEIYGGNREEFKKYVKIAESRGLNEQTFIMRLRRGWSLEDALNRPLHYVPRRSKTENI